MFVRLDSAQLRQFIDLSIVNELDVCERSLAFKAQYGSELLTRFRSWKGLGSETVLHDAEGLLSGTA